MPDVILEGEDRIQKEKDGNNTPPKDDTSKDKEK